MVKEFRLNQKIDWHDPWSDFDKGRYCYIVKPDKLSKYIDDLHKLYPEVRNVTLKIFKTTDAKWGDSSMFHAVVSQNLFATLGLSPKIHDVVIVNDGKQNYTAQITPYLRGEVANKTKMAEMYNKMRDISSERGWNMKMTQDLQHGNMIDGKWVDFQGVEPTEDTKKAVVKELNEVAHWQKSAGEVSYQELPGLVDGKRKMGRINNTLYTGKYVLDIGSSGGAECVSAEMSGALRVFGFDTEEIAPVAQRAAAIMCACNIDYFGHDLKNEDSYEFIKEKTGRDKFDVILFLSMHLHVGFPKYITKLMNKQSVFIFEGNRDLDNKRYEKDMKDAGLKIKKTGESHDLGARTIWEATL